MGDKKNQLKATNYLFYYLWHIVLESQNKIEDRAVEQLRLLRQRASITRYQRLLKLARLQGQFRRLATAAEHAAYESLIACEDWVPFEKVPRRTDS